ncbi:flagellar basal body-associated FliL family protein [Neptuniibacter pectenicola]|jgi:flagellar FliL protein|uniref:Flagellar protein FliL n=1 Tax=Neptuniibacter pectenicola TaxID=1806669 RepID=A0ABU9TTR0_9GAMM|nr:flagellar basal body-associated FliL family protein [Neptuniibacter pectenicola]KXJ51326.1 MAG: flagellar basal body-associated protein FliL [Neptuniibacter sp. Phe_28]|tara:strand:- start:11604 stop:12002 length:399 start_codon:yes stop_codon:yes gene_type:complete
MFKRLVLLMVMIFSVQFAAAETEKTVEDYVNYIELKSFTTNLDGVGKPRFLKCEVTIQVSSESAHHAVNAHMPQIRNDLVFLLSSQSDETVGTVDAQNRLAKKALEAVKKVLMEEEGESFVSDLFFTSFVVQ